MQACNQQLNIIYIIARLQAKSLAGHTRRLREVIFTDYPKTFGQVKAS